MIRSAIALLAAACIGFPLVVVLFFHDRDANRLHNATKNGELFIRDWRAMREGTWVVDGRFTRTTSVGQNVSYSFHIAQRLPNYVRNVGAAGEAAVDGRSYSCMIAASATPNLPATTTECKDAGPAPDFRNVVENDEKTTRRAVLGPSASYVVLARQQKLTEHCYTLVVRPQRVAGSWGTRAEFCFDDASHAPTLQRFVQATHVDALVADRVSGAPSAADVSIPKSSVSK